MWSWSWSAELKQNAPHVHEASWLAVARGRRTEPNSQRSRLVYIRAFCLSIYTFGLHSSVGPATVKARAARVMDSRSPGQCDEDDVYTEFGCL